MMKKCKKKVFFRIDPDDRVAVLETAERRGANFSEAIRESLTFYTGLSDGCRALVHGLSADHGIPASVVLENLALETLARTEAEDAILGGPVAIELFPKDLSGEPISGLAFLRMRESVWAGHYRQKSTPMKTKAQIDTIYAKNEQIREKIAGEELETDSQDRLPL